MKSALRVTMAALAPTIATLALGAAGCVSGGGTGSDSTVEIIHWWTAEGEKQAIEALLGYFAQQHPDEPVTNTPVMGSDMARATIKARMISGDPPDTFQANGGWDLLGWVLYNNIDASSSQMETIDDTAAAEHWADVIPPSVMSTVSWGMPPHIYAVPLDIHRINTMFYNVNLFSQSGLPMPETLDDLFAAAATFRAMGVKYPLALGTKDNTVPLLFFENLLVARSGGDFYLKFMRGLGDPFGPEIAAAVDDLATFFSYSNPTAPGLTWTQAADRVLAGDAALTLMGDWAKAYMLGRMAIIDQDFDAVTTPGTKGTFVFTTDTFGHPKGALNPQGTTDMLVAFGSQDGQDTFNPLKGSISPRSDSDTSKYDDLAKLTVADFQAASANGTLFPATALLAPKDFVTAVDKALRAFFTDGDKSALIHTIANYYDILRNGVLHL